MMNINMNKPFQQGINDSIKKELLDQMIREDSRAEFWVEYYDISIQNGTALNADRWSAEILWEELHRKLPEVAIVSIERL